LPEGIELHMTGWLTRHAEPVGIELRQFLTDAETNRKRRRVAKIPDKNRAK